jgi:hypothetical protein
MHFTNAFVTAVSVVTLRGAQVFAAPTPLNRYPYNETVASRAPNLTSETISPTSSALFSMSMNNTTTPFLEVAPLGVALHLPSKRDYEANLRQAFYANLAAMSKDTYANAAVKYRIKAMRQDLDEQTAQDCEGEYTQGDFTEYSTLIPGCIEINKFFKGIDQSIASTKDYNRYAMDDILFGIWKFRDELPNADPKNRDIALAKLRYFWIRWIPEPRGWGELEDLLASRPDESLRDEAFKKKAATLEQRIAQQRLFPLAITNIFNIWLSAIYRREDMTLQVWKTTLDNRPETIINADDNRWWRKYKARAIKGEPLALIHSRDKVSDNCWKKRRDARKKEERKGMGGKAKKNPPMRWTCVSGDEPYECCLSWQGVCTGTFEWEDARAAKCLKDKRCAVRL